MQPSVPSHPSSVARLLRALPTAHRVHLTAARWVAGFGVLHLLNHLLIPFGPETYAAGQAWVRWLYRTPVVEPLLVGLVVSQAASGLRLLWLTRHHPRPNRWQRWSGAFLSFFLVAHTAAALVQRWVVGRETNFYWAAAVLAFPTALFFVPYYTLGVTSFMIHLGIAMRRGPVRYWLAAGLGLSVLIIAGLSGWFAPVEVPIEYRLQ
jgi:succinate dehydrogenase/fumarate reductase cytochrome b subunit